MSSKPTLNDISLLVLETNSLEQSELIKILDGAGVRGTRKVVTSSDKVISELSSEDFGACIISPSVSTQEQLDLIRELSASGLTERVALISVIEVNEQDNLIPLMKAGAHAVELSPLSESRIEKALLRACYKLLERTRISSSSNEQVTNISWLLETVATRLEDLASKIETNDSLEDSVTANPKLVKEALLSAVGASGTQAEQFSEDFIKWLESRIKKSS